MAFKISENNTLAIRTLLLTKRSCWLAACWKVIYLLKGGGRRCRYLINENQYVQELAATQRSAGKNCVLVEIFVVVLVKIHISF